jgi:hypothetical protein
LAAGFPNTPDLLLEEAYEMKDDGSFARDDQGSPVPVGTSILISFDQAAWIELIDLTKGAENA